MAKVIVGMSGGVDSAVAAYLLKEAGHEVVGVTLRTWLADDGTEGRCCEIDEARRAARQIGIEYHPYNCLEDFKKYVTSPFVDEYLEGRTPNPCTVCNRLIKWDKMLYLMNVLEADYIATGHYSYITKLDNGRYSVKKAKHIQKDQTYMLYRLSQEQLAKTLMPLGDYSKDEVRAIAKKAGISIADKAESQEICFVTDGVYADYIKANTDKEIKEGNFIDEAANVLGRHKGIIYYTVGQRKGLGLAMGHPVFVKEIRPETNEVVIADRDAILNKEIIVSDLNYMGMAPLKAGESLECVVKVRYHHAGEKAKISAVTMDSLKIIFEKPVRAAAPGQSAVIYDGDVVLAGGVISKVI